MEIILFILKIEVDIRHFIFFTHVECALENVYAFWVR